ncbi:MAG TPA: hypothetical protein VLC95_11310 [Anaerolineae bacterium]|nr:hypothetical protein [Anaerolineae bacterium]
MTGNQDQASLHVQPERVVLSGVPRVGFQAEPGHDAQTMPFPACLTACLDYLGDGMGTREFDWRDSHWQQSNTYTYLLGVTGAAFRLSWRPGWHLDNVEIMYMSDEPTAPFERAFESVGREYEFLMPQEGSDNRAYWLERIAESVRDLGRPVLVFGVVGPPECCIVAGYDEGGDVLVGWSFFQHFPEFNQGVEFEPNGYYRKRDWFENTQTPLILGDRRERPPLREIYCRALRWALHVVRTPETTAYHAPRHNGLAAYQAWADHLAMSDEFAAGDLKELWERYMVHNDAVGLVAEGRWYAAAFLRKLVADEPVAADEPAVAEPLLAAAAKYEAEHDLMWQIWHLTGGIGLSDHHVHKLADPAVRSQIVPIILQARDLDAAAADDIERAVGMLCD